MPACLILGSPIAAAGLAHSVALIGHFLLPEVAWLTVLAALMLRFNFLLATFGSAIGAIRVSGSVPTRVAIVIASVVCAAAIYAASIYLTFEFIPGYADRYGID